MMRATFYTLCLCAALLCPATAFTQGVGKPKIMNIPGGFFVEWASPVEVAAVHLDKGLTGPFEVMFDVPSVDFLNALTSKVPEHALTPEMVTPLADYWIVRGKPERAIPLYEACLQRGDLDEKRALVFHNNCAMLYSQVLGEHEKALKLVNDALETRRDNYTLLDTKGLILMNSGNPAEAVPHLERAVELSCQVPIYCMHLACALLRDSRLPVARQRLNPVLDKLMESAPSMTKENRKMLDELLTAFPADGDQ
jgi:tetratricopeptide (TPR) repeat protein